MQKSVHWVPTNMQSTGASAAPTAPASQSSIVEHVSGAGTGTPNASVTNAQTSEQAQSGNVLSSKPLTIPILPGAVPTKPARVSRPPTAKQLEALEVIRARRSAEAAAKKAAKEAQKAAVGLAAAAAKSQAAVTKAAAVAAKSAAAIDKLPVSLAAQGRRRTQDMAELPAVLRRMESKMEARLQTVMDTVSKIAKANAAATMPIHGLRHFPTPSADVMRLLKPGGPTQTTSLLSSMGIATHGGRSKAAPRRVLKTATFQPATSLAPSVMSAPASVEDYEQDDAETPASAAGDEDDMDGTTLAEEDDIVVDDELEIDGGGEEDGESSVEDPF